MSSSVGVWVKQERVVSWHAHITQIEDSVRHCQTMVADYQREDVARELDDILADLGTLRGHLPPIQPELPF